MDRNVTEKPPRAVVNRFELAAARMADAWVRAGRVTVTSDDVDLACDFLQATGWKVSDGRAGRLRVVARRSRQVLQLTPEGAVLLAMRRLAGRR